LSWHFTPQLASRVYPSRCAASAGDGIKNISTFVTMNASKLNSWLTRFQGVYYLLTAVWPIVHIESFIWVTGPKTDIWLVKTVSALLIPIGLTILLALRRTTPILEVAVLAGGAAIALAVIDIVYVANGTISRIYLADAVVELPLAAAWFFCIAKHRLEGRYPQP
jgi:hypothetical protein